MDTVGKRVEPVNSILHLNKGEYGKSEGIWYCRTPNGHLGCLKNHSVQENQDGTITVSPSILVTDSKEEWHGFLVDGVWKPC